MADSLRGTLIDSVGRPISSVLVKVYVAGGALASIYSDKTLTTLIVNDGISSPLTEADGAWGPYYAASGRYDIKFAKTGYVFDDTDTADVEVFDPTQSGAAAIIASASYQGLAAGTIQDALIQHEKEKAKFADDWQDHVASGLLGIDPGASLTMIIPGGIAYVIGVRVVKPNGAVDLTRTYTASKDTYVDISDAGVITYTEVVNGAGAPAIAGSSIRLMKVITNGTEITSVADLRILTPGVKTTAGIVASPESFGANPAPNMIATRDSYGRVNIANNLYEISAYISSSPLLTTATDTKIPFCLVKNDPDGTFGTRNVPCTISFATPAVVTANEHGYQINDPIIFATTGVLPSPLVAGTVYWIIAAGFGQNSFEIATARLGAAINTADAGSGSHTVGCMARWTPKVVGKYLISIKAKVSSNTAITYQGVGIFKNGTCYRHTDEQQATGTLDHSVQITYIIDMNGTTDYLEGWVRVVGTAALDLKTLTDVPAVLGSSEAPTFVAVRVAN